jgi:hypothetical protein
LKQANQLALFKLCFLCYFFLYSRKYIQKKGVTK